MGPMKCASLTDRNGIVHMEWVRYMKLGSPKIDGNRCYVEDDIAKSSSGKHTRNKFIREYLSRPELNHLDGEIVVGPPTASDVRRKTSSGVTTIAGEPDFTLMVFDYRSKLHLPFKYRLEETRNRVITINDPRVIFVEHTPVEDEEDLVTFEGRVLAQGYEGIVLRDPDAPYVGKHSTIVENYALKLKRFVDSEAVILGTEELLHNDNEQTTDDLGRSVRSSHKENKRGSGLMGALIVRDIKTGVVFKIGTGFDAQDRAAYWRIGDIVTYKHFPVGAKDKPNLPSYISVRHADDMTDPEPVDLSKTPF